MPLYLVKANEPDWDDYIGFVIRATDEERARVIAHCKTRFEQRKDLTFLNPSQSTCERILEDGDEEIIIDSFKAG